MKIANKFIKQILESTRIRAELCAVLGKNYHCVQKYVKDNKVNGPLTTAVALKVICTNLKVKESELLTEAK